MITSLAGKSPPPSNIEPCRAARTSPSKARHEIRGLLQRAESVERGLHALKIEAGEAVGVGLDPEPPAPAPALLEYVLEIPGGIDAFGVVPDPDVRDHRGVLGL